MSKIIKLTADYIEECKREFEEYLSSGKMTNGRIAYNKTLQATGDKAELIFSEDAWWKMQALIREWDCEIAWHGTAERGEVDGEYLITDILIYPQQVSGASVNTDQNEYENWLMALDDDRFNNLRMQGHSHVHMSTTPSGVDEQHQRGIVDQLGEEDFYIFVIWNKNNEHTVRIYDMKKNTLYENSDVDVTILYEDGGLQDLLDEAKEVVVKQAVTTTHYVGKTYGKPKTTYNNQKTPKYDDYLYPSGSYYSNGFAAYGYE